MTMKAIIEILENLLNIWKRDEIITKKAETVCWYSKTGLPLNAKCVISCCCWKVTRGIYEGRDLVVDILLNAILIWRGLVAHQQKWDEMKLIRMTTGVITMESNTGGQTSEERKGVCWGNAQTHC